MKGEASHDFVGRQLACLPDPFVRRRGVAAEGINACEMRQRADVTRIQFEDFDECVARRRHRLTAERVQVEERFAEPEPGVRVIRIVVDEARVLGFRPLDEALEGRVGLVDLDTPVELVGDSLAGLRIFAGYAGWGAEQLAAEIEEGSWYVVPGEVPDVFRTDPTDLKRDVLRRQPGELAWHSTRPVDPELN